MQTQLAVVALVLSLVALGVAGQVYARVKADYDIDAEAQAREDAETARWRSLVASAARVDASKPIEVAPGSLVLVQGRLEGAGALTDDVFGVSRAGALSLERKGWIAQKEAYESTEAYWDPVRRPSDGTLPGESNWWSGGGKTRQRTKRATFMRWKPAWPGSPRDEALAIRSTNATFTESAKIGSIPLSPDIFRNIPRTTTVPFGDDALSKVPDAFRERARVVEDDGFHAIEIDGGAPGGQRLALLEAPAGDVTLLAGWNGSMLVPWKDPASDDIVTRSAPGFVDAETFVPKHDPRLEPGDAPWKRVLKDGPRAALVFGGGLFGVLALVFALARLLRAGR